MEGQRLELHGGGEAADEGLVEGAVLGLRVALVLADARLVRPAGDLAEAGGHAAGAVLALVAVDQDRVVAPVQNKLEDLDQRRGRGVPVRFLVGQHVDVVVRDAVRSHEGGVGRRDVLGDEGDDGLEAERLQLVEMGRLRVAAAVDARADRVEVRGQAGTVGRWRLGYVVFHGNGHGSRCGA